MADVTERSSQQRWIELLAGRGGGFGAAVVRAAAAGGSVVYRAVVACRNAGYDAGLLPARKLARPVISVGNLSAGGTGKTVLAEAIARWILDAGRRPAILLRGYRGRRLAADSPSAVLSDEAAMLGELLGDDVAVEPDPDRHAAAGRLLAGPRPPDAFILDDGFQHRRVARDLDIVAVDATAGLAGPLARLLPRGLLREPVRSLARADAVVLTRADQAGDDAIERTRRIIVSAAPGVAVLRSRHAAAGLRVRTPAGDRSVPLSELGARKYLAFCGIGNPEAFGRTLADLPGECVGLVAFDDHHAYTAAEVAALAGRARAAGAQALVTTRKDLVKLSADWSELPVLAVTVELAWLDDPAELKGRILELLWSKERRL